MLLMHVGKPYDQRTLTSTMRGQHRVEMPQQARLDAMVKQMMEHMVAQQAERSAKIRAEQVIMGSQPVPITVFHYERHGL